MARYEGFAFFAKLATICVRRKHLTGPRPPCNTYATRQVLIEILTDFGRSDVDRGAKYPKIEGFQKAQYSLVWCDF